jgi:hypothetical protein
MPHMSKVFAALVAVFMATGAITAEAATLKHKKAHSHAHKKMAKPAAMPAK